ncbi:response regulator [Granulicatella sp. zg-ZJ]|uniref:response regulator transcription factor n=1 Tax=Granulicatella sp. zg-ZJ TaxID=2678504 RepID=UPI0013D80D50|nr:response regulator [Granulicatella sp. zg-ZJ]MBS4750865.1 response regulator [Carnobacteriaceae bacterium zg-ZUI78]NEW62732.1 response regulator [Granulicatella sp. zg-ZJ]
MRILIIEDDPMVAMIHQEYVKRLDEKYDVKHVKTLKEAKQELENYLFDIVLLDNYLPDGQGVSFLEHCKGLAVIMITAANDSMTVKTALSSGIVDYLVKPFVFERFSQAIEKAKVYCGLLSKEKISQDNIDKYFNFEKETMTLDSLPKGLAKITLAKVIAQILTHQSGFTTQEIADELDISRITIKKYLNYLVDVEALLEDVNYLTLGRPVSIYTIKNMDILENL